MEDSAGEFPAKDNRGFFRTKRRPNGADWYKDVVGGIGLRSLAFCQGEWDELSRELSLTYFLCRYFPLRFLWRILRALP